ncbi:MAG TPA: hypothetical protein VE980_24920 [Pyrinomonadaceae bacterium]|nr:hypothetical protein [Pyrinomonadaceae bacterium]
MSPWTSAVICVLLFSSGQSQAQQVDPVTKKDWNITQAYIDVFKILENQNTCSEFYRGPRTATIVLNGFVRRVKSQSLVRGVSFEMAGSPRIIRDPVTGASYRLFEKTMVNTNGSFYKRRADPLRKFPSDVGNFAPGSRAARALILLHELGHLIQAENGEWLIPDDGFDNTQSKANTLRVQQVCRKELNALN